ncbi:putative AC transposase [Senna tora]|uniref:Putative AC transposase n=1 Tax=Senna tora TaxID=362788 RepID=A0A834T035_9FABA|nr:putative AC transposase [Senna tora]
MIHTHFHFTKLKPRNPSRNGLQASKVVRGCDPGGASKVVRLRQMEGSQSLENKEEASSSSPLNNPLNSSSSPSPIMSNCPLNSSNPPCSVSVDVDLVAVNEDGVEKVVGHKRKSLVVWNHFKKVKINGEDKAECNYCSKKLTAKDAFNRLKARESLYTFAPTKNDWELAKEICGRLGLFSRVTEMFSRTQYPTSNLFFFPLMCEIRLSLQNWLSSSIGTISNMASKMMTKFEKFWSTVHGVMGVAIVLDPRYKLKLVEYFFPHFYGNSSEMEMDKIKRLCYSLFYEYEAKSAKDETLREKSDEAEPQNDVRDILKGYDSFVNSDISLVKSELDLYLEEKVLPREPTFDILNWWKHTGIKYPTIQKITRDILAIPISTVASEYAFSTGGRLISPHRSRLKENTLEALMCTQNWLCKEQRDHFGINLGHVKDARFRVYESDSDVEDEVSEITSTTSCS